ncbi:MAG: ribonuclease P [Candidatus Aenigmarchaeota archaeon]|nr:ribonuclease P [Candidatus Aenigmarchaeota archaeon]
MKAARSRSRRPQAWTNIAKERIGILVSLAEKEAKRHPERTKRYVDLARRIGMRYNVRLDKGTRIRICKECSSFLIPGYNCTVRTRSDKQSLVVTCNKCGSVKRYPYSKEKKA